MMNTLEKKDLIIKKTNPEDTRSINIYLTYTYIKSTLSAISFALFKSIT